MNNRVLSVLVGLIFFLFTVACAGTSIVTPERNLQESVHYYIYDQQPVSGAAFVQWADAHLSRYSAKQVQKALYTEGKRQAKEGHPNAVAALSFADQAWSKEKGLKYDRDRWVKLQETAKENLRQVPSGTLQLWPPSK